MNTRDLPAYSYVTFFDTPSGEYVAECREIPGLSGVAATKTEALESLKEVIAAWLEILQEDGMSFPPPDAAQEPEPSGIRDLCAVCGYEMDDPLEDYTICPSCGTDFCSQDTENMYEEFSVRLSQAEFRFEATAVSTDNDPLLSNVIKEVLENIRPGKPSFNVRYQRQAA